MEATVNIQNQQPTLKVFSFNNGGACQSLKKSTAHIKSFYRLLKRSSL